MQDFILAYSRLPFAGSMQAFASAVQTNTPGFVPDSQVLPPGAIMWERRLKEKIHCSGYMDSYSSAPVFPNYALVREFLLKHQMLDVLCGLGYFLQRTG